MKGQIVFLPLIEMKPRISVIDKLSVRWFRELRVLILQIDPLRFPFWHCNATTALTIKKPSWGRENRF